MADPEVLNEEQGYAAAQGAAEGEKVDLEKMNKEQLLSYAEEIGAKGKVKQAMNKPEIIQVIRDFQHGGDPEVLNEEQAGADGDDPATQGGTEGEMPPTGSTPPTYPAKGIAPAIPVGTIKIENGVEVVNVGGMEWVPTIRENITSDKPVVVISKKRAGKTIFARSGKPITFDSEGRATVSALDGLYLKDLSDYSLENE